MRIGILGSGLMGSKLGTIFARSGHEVVFSDARSNDKIKKLARDAQGNTRAIAGRALVPSRRCARAGGRFVWQGDRNVLSGNGCRQQELITANTSSGAEELAKKAPRAHVVAAFQTVPSEVLFGVFEARRKKNGPSLVYCGDDESGKDCGR